MNKYFFHTILALLVIGCGNKVERKKEAPSNEVLVQIGELPPVDSIEFENLFKNPNNLIKNFVTSFTSKDTSNIEKYLVSTKEHKGLYYHTPEADLNPQSAEFIASLFEMSNNKHLGRWLDAFSERGYKYSRHTIGSAIKKGVGFEILGNCRLWVINKEGKEEEIELFRSLLKLTTVTDSLRGYKIWSILDD